MVSYVESFFIGSMWEVAVGGCAGVLDGYDYVLNANRNDAHYNRTVLWATRRLSAHLNRSTVEVTSDYFSEPALHSQLAECMQQTNMSRPQ